MMRGAAPRCQAFQAGGADSHICVGPVHAYLTTLHPRRYAPGVATTCGSCGRPVSAYCEKGAASARRRPVLNDADNCRWCGRPRSARADALERALARPGDDFTVREHSQVNKASVARG